MKKIILLLLIFALLSVSGTLAQTDVLQVDASISEGAINPYVYGASYGPWAMVSPDLTPLAADSGLTLFRFPGGYWGDDYDIRPQHIDLFMFQARAWGAQPSISTRVVNGSPEKSAALVQYTNVEKDYDVRYWSIGNEPTLYDGYDIQRFNEEWREHALAMLEVDPDIILIGPEVHQYPSTDNPPEYLNEMRVWVREFLKANGDLVGMVSIHRYPFPVSNTSSTTTDDLRRNTAEMDKMIEILRADIQAAVGHDMPIAITEINSHWTSSLGTQASPDSFYNAIWWADSLARLIRQKVDLISYFALVASPSSGLGMLSRYEPRPVYFVYQIYQRFGSELLSSSSPDPDVSIYAARRDDGALTLIVINLGPDEVTKTLELAGFTPGGDAEVWRFDANHNAEQIDPVAVADGATLTLPGQSITLYVLPASD